MKRLALVAIALAVLAGCSDKNSDPSKGQFNHVVNVGAEDGTGLPDGFYGNDAERYELSTYQLPDGTNLKCISGMDHGLSCDWDHRTESPTTTTTVP